MGYCRVSLSGDSAKPAGRKKIATRFIVGLEGAFRIDSVPVGTTDIIGKRSALLMQSTRARHDSGPPIWRPGRSRLQSFVTSASCGLWRTPDF
jgi:hypothetical protein